MTLTAEGPAGKGRQCDVADNLRRPEEREGLEDDETDNLGGGARLSELAGCAVDRQSGSGRRWLM